MENIYTKLTPNRDEDIQMNSTTDFEFIRQRNIYKEKNNTQQNSYSMLQKTNNIFTNNKNTEMKSIDDKVYNNPIEQKENINYFSNQINVNDDKNISSNINRIKNKINEVENSIKLINNDINKDNQLKFNYEKNLEKSSLINNYKPEMNPEDNKFNLNNLINNDNKNKMTNNKGYYFNYKSDESFNKINEKNTKQYPIDISLNSLYNNRTTEIISSTNNNYELKANSIIFDSSNKKVENNDYYKGFMNKIEMRNDLINKDTFDSIKQNISFDNNNNNNNNNLNQVNVNNNLRKDYSSKSLSVNSNLISQKKLNLDYNISNDLQSSKSNNNILNNYNNKTNDDSLYNTERRNNIKSYFQLKERDNLYNFTNNLAHNFTHDYTNNILSSNKNDQTLSSFSDETTKELVDYSSRDKTNTNAIKSLKNYHSFSTPKNHYININNDIEKIMKIKPNLENINTNYTSYRMNTNENKKDEMTQTVQENDENKFYSLTQNRSYRSHNQFTVDNSSQTYNDNDNFDKKYLNTNININNKTNYDIHKTQEAEVNDKNKNMENIDNNRQLNTLLNKTFQPHNNSCIHKCNTYRNKRINKNGMNLFKRNNKNLNLGFNGMNRNICEKCFKSKMNFAKLTQMRICNNCRELINNGNFNIDKNNYFTFN